MQRSRCLDCGRKSCGGSKTIREAPRAAYAAFPRCPRNASTSRSQVRIRFESRAVRLTRPAFMFGSNAVRRPFLPTRGEGVGINTQVGPECLNSAPKRHQSNPMPNSAARVLDLLIGVMVSVHNLVGAT